MSEPITIHPSRLSAFGPADGAVFCLITNPEIADAIVVEHDGSYRDYLTVLLGAGDEFDDVLVQQVPQEAHVVVISPVHFFISPEPEVLGPRRKLLALACNSTPTALEDIRHFVDVMERTSAAEQDAFSERFFELAESTDQLIYVDERHGTRATLDHLREDLVWNQQAGSLDWGDQQLVPAGEISVLPIGIFDFDENLHLPLDGEIAFRGYPILHGGKMSFTREDQARIQRTLWPLKEYAVVAAVQKGRMTALRPFSPEAEPLARMLEAMFAVDSRYELVWEMGHAMNTALEIWPGNHAMNETYGSTHGCLHFGLGITPYTQYHLDIVAPDTTVYTDAGDVVLGMKGGSTLDRVAVRA
jgi:hypothetical protein